MTDPFRSELEAAHQRIERMEADHRARVAELERENARLRNRLVEVAPSRTRTGRVFLAIGMISLGASLAGGMVFARMQGPPPSPVHVAVHDETIELNSSPSSSPSAFDTAGAEKALGAIRIDDCVDASHRPGSGHLSFLIASNGFVVSTRIDRGDYRTTSEGRCIENRFRAARVPSFEGDPRTVGMAFTIR